MCRALYVWIVFITLFYKLRSASSSSPPPFPQSSQYSVQFGTSFQHSASYISYLACFYSTSGLTRARIFRGLETLPCYLIQFLSLIHTFRGMRSECGDGVPAKEQTESLLVDEDSGGSGSGGLILKKGPWTSAEDAILVEYVKKHGEGNWNAVQKHSGLFRCGKSCRLRWANHLRPNLKKGTFTAEEEQLIIELHAKMGNKWARMAAHLPGRTDNEIKNYWNTRIKRRQRAGLPLYPPEVCLQALQSSQSGQNGGGTDSRDKDHHDLLQSDRYEIPDILFDDFNVNQGILPYVHEPPDISSGRMLMKGLHASQYCTSMPPPMHPQKRLRESMVLYPGPKDGVRSLLDQFQGDTCDKVAQSVGSCFLLEHDPATNFGSIQGGQSLSNGNSSASKPSTGVEKLELPSLQYAETELGSWENSPTPPMLESVDAFIQSPLESVDAFIQFPPLPRMFESDCLSPRNSGLLDALLHEAKFRSSAKNNSSDKSSNSSSVTPADVADSSNLNVCETEWEDYTETISPFGNCATLFSECTPISASGSSFDDPLPAETFSGGNVKSEPVDHTWTPEGEKESKTRVGFTRPDALLGSDWFVEQSCGFIKDQPNMNRAISTVFKDDLSFGSKKMAGGTSTTSIPGWGLGSCA